MGQKLLKKKKKGIAERKTAQPKKRPFGDFSVKAALMGVLLWAAVIYIFYGIGISSHIDIAEGHIVQSAVTALVDFKCENLAETDFNRKSAERSIPPVFVLKPTPEQNATLKISKIFGRLQQYYSAKTNQMHIIKKSLDDLLIGIPVSSTEIVDLFPTNNIEQVQSVVISNLSSVISTGIISDDYRQTLFNDAAQNKLTIIRDKTNTSTPIDKIYTSHTAVKTLTDAITPLTKNTKVGGEILSRLFEPLAQANLSYDHETHTRLKNDVVSAVKPTIQTYLKGTTLASAGEKATEQTILLLQKHEEKRTKERDAKSQLMQIVGNGLLLLFGLITVSLILQIVTPQTATKSSHLLLLAILSLATLFIARLSLFLVNQYQLIPSSVLMYIIPHAFAVLLAGILIGSSSAICLGLWTSFAAAILFKQSFDVFALGMLITITATCTARNIHKRSSLFKAGIWVCAVKVLYVLISGVLNQPVISVLIGQLIGAIISGMLSTLFAMLFIPVFERLFNLTTDITLLELSDMGHPLLQKMAIQAPGTYHHSLMVATLAQNAAERIGANSLLTRVCAYYHDIGKMAKPEFFTENIQHKENPHDELSPHMSALVITSHVKEGLTLAKRNKLPQPILDAIEQHHGNGLISFFYHKAKTQTEKEAASNGSAASEKINDSDFRYGGRPAVSKEMAILALADSSEAASRSIEKPTPQKIANLIKEIFAAKIRDGQLDYADLSMAEITEVRESFVFSLSNMLHGRIAYPKDDENNGNKKTEEASDSAEKNSDAD